MELLSKEPIITILESKGRVLDKYEIVRLQQMVDFENAHRRAFMNKGYWIHTEKKLIEIFTIKSE